MMVCTSGREYWQSCQAASCVSRTPLDTGYRAITNDWGVRWERGLITQMIWGLICFLIQCFACVARGKASIATHSPAGASSQSDHTITYFPLSDEDKCCCNRSA
ncbi:hypothetical protein BS47DRAFT_49677 [Hydnum rufescens UP504]|uniref:Uncharacterized protein n=1 Tax=Hydnum rufescens UP504 TaxID=1448309 RepID=A0A9P6DQ25_9AGAM|nr:hypothetical protein BS47DRAFT_49677 [Hydnum rufescens UP504]